MTLKIYHNPRCSKSRKTLELLRDKGVEPEIVEYLKATPSSQELVEIIEKLGTSARSVLRKGEAAYKELVLKDETLSDEAIVRAIVSNPILLERPIVVSGDRAIIGRPPENVLDLLD